MKKPSKDIQLKNYILGRKINITLPNGEKREGQYAIVNLDEIEASHNENTFASNPKFPHDSTGRNINDRNYQDDPNAQAKVIEVASNLDPDRLIEYSKKASGTPIITTDGIVVSGNNRTMSLKLADSKYAPKYTVYKDQLMDELDIFDIDYSNRIGVGKIDRPVLVRFDYGFPEYTTLEMSKYNQDTKKSERPIDFAIKLGAILNNAENCKTQLFNIVGKYDTFSEFYENKQDQKLVVDLLVNCGVITNNQLAKYYDKGFNSEGKNLIENLLAGTYLSKDNLILTDTEGMKRIKQTIIVALPVLIKNENLTEGSLKTSINKAIELQNKIKSSGLSFKDYITQQSMFDTPPSYEVQVMNRLLDSGQRKFKKALESYNTTIESSQGATLFGSAPDKSEVFEKRIVEALGDTKKEITVMSRDIVDKIESDTIAQTEFDENLFINDNFYDKFPEKMLGEAKEVSGMHGPVTIYVGSEKVIEQIDVEAPEINNPSISVTTTLDLNSPTSLENGKIANKKAKEEIGKKAARRKKKTTPVQGSLDSDVYSFTECYELEYEDGTKLNGKISNDELKAYVFYKEYIGQKLSNKWYELIINITGSPLRQNLEYFVKNGLLFYSNGKYIPKYKFLSGDIYKRKTQLDAEKDFIISEYGPNVYENAKNLLDFVFDDKFKNKLKLEGSSSETGLILRPLSKFSRTTTINHLSDEQPFKVLRITAQAQGFYGMPNFDKELAGGVSNYKRDEFEELNLTNAFVYWLIFYKNEYEIKSNVSVYEIFRYYIKGGNRPKELQRDDKGSAAFNKEQDTKWLILQTTTRSEGDRLFLDFLYSALTESDRQRIEFKWNKLYNSHIEPDYDKVPVAFEFAKNYLGGLVDIRPEKREAVTFLSEKGSGCLAYDVGVGKTWSAIFTVGQFLDNGYCKRPFFVVPNQVYKQFLSEIKGLLPNRKVNELYNLNDRVIEELWDSEDDITAVDEGSISIMTYEGFEQLGFNEQTENELKWELHDILAQDEIKEGTAKEKKKTAFLERIEGLIGKGLKGGFVNIEDLGFDFVTFDEAHALKKVFTTISGEEKSEIQGNKTRNEYKLSSGRPSGLGLKGFMICQYIQRKNVTGNVLLLTATPFTNSPLEVYSMLSLVAYNYLKDTDLNNLNAFFDNYILQKFEIVINSRLQPVFKPVVKSFNNLASLRSLIFNFINFKSGEEIKGLIRPNKYVIPLKSKSINGNVIKLSADEKVDSYIAMNDVQKRYNNDVIAYVEGEASLECVESKLNKDVEETEDETEETEVSTEVLSDNDQLGTRVLRGMSFSRDVALSPYLYKCNDLEPPSYIEFVENSPKIKYVIECIKSVKKHHENNGTPISGQVIYMDRALSYFPLIKEYLIKEVGYKDHEIGLIYGGMEKPKEMKEVIKNAFNGERFNDKTGLYETLSDDERMKIIIGSGTIKEGMNLQKYATTLYNLTLDWNPTDNQQLHGRIWRQKNPFKNVRIVNPLMIDSMDIFMNQKLEEKTDRINSLVSKSSDTQVLNVEDFDPQAIKYQLIKDPKILANLEIVEKNQQLKNDKALLERNKEKAVEVEKLVKEVIGYVTVPKEHLKKVNDPNEIENLGIEETYKKMYSYLKTPKNKDGKKFISDTIRKVLKNELEAYAKKNKIDISYNYSEHYREYIDKKGYIDQDAPYLDYRWDAYVNKAYKNFDRIKANFLIPNNIPTDLDDPTLLNKLLMLGGEIESKLIKIEEEQKELNSDAKFKQLVDEIIEKKEKFKITEKPISKMVEEFESLNYLLDDVKVKKQADKPLSCPPVDSQGERRIDAEGLELLQKCIDNDPSTKDLHTDDKGVYNQDRIKIHNEILHEFDDSKTCLSQVQPVAIFMGGAPGSGKSTFLKKYAPYMTSDLIYKIDADDVRAKLPEYKGWNANSTHLETKDIVSKLIDNVATPCVHDIVFDGTMSSPKNYLRIIQKVKRYGYKTFIIFMKVPKEVSIERAMGRYQRSGRFVPVFVIDEFFKDSDKTFNQLKEMVNGYIVVDGITQTILEEGGEEIPQDRPYFKGGGKSEPKAAGPKAEETKPVDSKILDTRLKLIEKRLAKDPDNRLLRTRLKLINKLKKKTMEKSQEKSEVKTGESSDKLTYNEFLQKVYDWYKETRPDSGKPKPHLISRWYDEYLEGTKDFKFLPKKNSEKKPEVKQDYDWQNVPTELQPR